MATTVRVDKVCCATCQYWDGERRLEFQNKKPYLVKFELSERAICPSDRNMKTGTHGTGCRSYKRWNDL